MTARTQRRFGTALAAVSVLGIVGIIAWLTFLKVDLDTQQQRANARVSSLEHTAGKLASDLAAQRAQFERCKKAPVGAAGCTQPVSRPPAVVAGAPGRGIASTSVNSAGVLSVVYTDGTTQIVGNVRGSRGAQGPNGTTGQPGPRSTVAGPDGAAGPAGQDGSDGADGATGPQGPPGPAGPAGPEGDAGRGIDTLNVDDAGHLVVKYSDGEQRDLGRVTGRDGVGIADLSCDSVTPIRFTLVLTDGTTKPFECGGQPPKP